jgi:4'-phosphopantetheinyl transferase
MRRPLNASHLWIRPAACPDGQLTASEQAELSTVSHAGRAAEIRRSRPWARAVLAGYLNVDPLAVRFRRGRWGKPYLVGHSLQFNLAHTGDQVVLAISDRPVGIDIEPDSRDLRRVVARCSSEDERRRLTGCSRAEVVAVWALKEAYTKALGLGHRLAFAGIETVAGSVDGRWSVRGDRETALDLRTDVPGHVVAVARSTSSPVIAL